MRIIKKIALFTLFAAIGSAALAAFPAERIYAGTYDISKADITIDCSSNIQKVTGNDSDNNHYDSK